MPNNAEQSVISALKAILTRRADDDVDVSMESRLMDDLQLDSLEVAEFSAVLEDDLGTDPYSEGISPATVREVVAFYNG